MKEVITHTISSLEMARIGKIMHSVLMQNIRFVLSKMNLPQGKYLAEDAKSYDLPREVAELVAKDNFDWTQREDVSDHFNVLELEKAVSKAAVQQAVKAKAVTTKTLNLDYDVNKTITSLDLVEIINNVRKEESRPTINHKDFMKKVKKVLGEGVGKFSHTYIHPQNQQEYPCYRFPKREAELMVMSESYKVQAKVYDRMVALESPQNNPALPNYPEALRQLACAMELAAEHEKKLAEAAPMIEFHHAVTAAENAHTFEEAAKVLNVGRNTFIGILRDNKLLTKANLPAQTAINQGHFTVIEDPYTNTKGATMLRASPRITGKGLTFIQKLI